MKKAGGIMKQAVAALMMAVLFVTALPMQARADNAVLEETMISGEIPDFSTASVEPEAITWERFIWPNEEGQYSYAYENAQSGKKYMLLVITGVYKSINGLQREDILSRLVYIDQQTAAGNTVAFNGFIPARAENSTLVISGEGMSPTIVGYISKDIFRFGMYVADETGTKELDETYNVGRNITWTECRQQLPTQGYMEIYSEYVDVFYLPVFLSWREAQDFDTTKAGKINRVVADVVPEESAIGNGLAALIRPFVIHVIVEDSESLPVTISASKGKTIYSVGETVTDSDIAVRAIYEDGTVRNITGWITDAGSMDTTTPGSRFITVTYVEKGIAFTTKVEIIVVSSEEEVASKCVVRFQTFGGTYIQSMIVDAGVLLTLPEDPVKTGYKFSGWYTDRYRTKAFNAETVIETDMTLYAAWVDLDTPLLYRLRARLMQYNIPVGSVLTQDMILVDAIYDDGSSRRVDDYICDLDSIDQTVPGNKVINLQYTEGPLSQSCMVNFRILEESSQEMFVVSFDSGCGLAIEPCRVVSGEKAAAPNVVLEKEGYVFAGWYDGSVKWDFAVNTVTRDLTLQAKWLKGYGTDTDLYGFIEEDLSYAYTGKAIKPDLVILDSNFNLLTNKKDYAVKYRNNINVSKPDAPAEAIVTGKGNYTGTLTIAFTIVQKDIADKDAVSVTMRTFDTYKASGYKIVPAMKYNGKKLSAGKDFTVSYLLLDGWQSETGTPVTDSRLTKSGYYRIKVTGIGNYTGSIELPYQIAATGYKNLAKAKISLKKEYRNIVYTGNAVMVNDGLSVSFGKQNLSEGRDYELVYPENVTDIGKKSVKIRALPSSSVCFGEKTFTYSITGLTVGNAKVNFKAEALDYQDDLIVDNIDSVTLMLNKSKADALNRYYGSTYGSGDVYALKKDIDYKVTYVNNSNAGKASVRIEGMGLFSGMKKAQFSIRRISITDEAVSVKMANKTVKQDKSGAEVDLRVTFNGAGRMVRLKEGHDYTVSYKGNKKAGSGACVVVKGIGNYTGKVTLDFDIAKKGLTSKDIRISVSNPSALSKNGSYVYKPVITITDQGAKLKNNSDYVIDYAGCVTQSALEEGNNIGYVVVKEKDKGSYTGQRTVVYRVVKNSIASGKCTITVSDQTYTGKAIEFDLDKEEDLAFFKAECVLADGSRVELAAGRDFEIVGYSNNIKCGKAAVTIKGIGSYTGTKTVHFTILKRKLQ